MSLAFLTASNRLEGSRAKQIYTFLIFFYPEQNWTVSSLADTAYRDRVTVRKQLASLDHWFEDNDWRTLRMNEVGQQAMIMRVKRFYKSIDQPYRGCLKTMFKGDENPLVSICELAIRWEFLSRLTGKSPAFLAVYAVLFLHRGNGLSALEICSISQYSKQTVHRQLAEMEDTGFVRSSKGLWKIHAIGYAKMFPLVANAVLKGEKTTISQIVKVSELIVESQSSHQGN